MNLETPSKENIIFILDELKKRLTMANTSVMNPDSFELNVYEDLLDLYQLVTRKEKVSISEMEAIVKELGKMRKR